MYRLVFLNGKMKGRRIAVQQGTISIGRDPKCHIDIASDDEVSRNHAEIEQRPDGTYLKDLGAMNRTELNGKQVVGEAKLKHGDKLEIGRTQIEFQDIEKGSESSKRTVSAIQRFTFLAIGAIIIIQVLFVVVLPMLHQETSGSSGKAGPAAAKPTSAVPVAVVSAPAAVETGKPAETVAFDSTAALSNVVIVQTSAAPAAAVAVSDDVTSEVHQLREALVELQKQLADLNQQTTQLTNPAAAPREGGAPAEGAPAAAAAPVETNAPVAAAPVNTDALLQKAKSMLTEATNLVAQSRLGEADGALERVELLAPDFTPAYVERARLYEARGMLAKAGEQWTRVMELSVGTPLYEQAAAERQRVARAELIQTMTGEKEEGGTGSAQDKFARHVRIINVEREKFEANQEFDEMRLLRINVKPRMSEGEIDTEQFTCTVIFYDRSLYKQTVRPTRALAPKDALKVQGQWPAGEQRTLTAAYIVPKGFRDEEEKTVGEKRTYEGYRVFIYYKGVLQDESALPKNLSDQPAPAPPERTGK